MDAKSPWGDPSLHRAADAARNADEAARDADIFLACERLIALTSIYPKNVDAVTAQRERATSAAYELFKHCAQRLPEMATSGPAAAIGFCVDTMAMMAAMQAKAGRAEQLAHALSAQLYIRIVEMDKIVQAVNGAPGEKAAP